MGDHARFRLGSKDVTAKVVDGEAIIVHLTTGMFYSLQRTGALAWSLLGAGHSIAETADRLAAHFEVERDRALADVRALALELVADALLAPAEGGHAPVRSAVDWPAGGREPYAPPELVKYTDIGDLLALDPPIPMAAEPEAGADSAAA